MDRKTKPLGALGRLEALAIQIGVVLGTNTPVLLKPQLFVFAGEMGIGNTSSASLIMSRLTHTPIESCTGAGTGLTPDAVKRKPRSPNPTGCTGCIWWI